jgi:hypothetical protein
MRDSIGKTSAAASVVRAVRRAPVETNAQQVSNLLDNGRGEMVR